MDKFPVSTPRPHPPPRQTVVDEIEIKQVKSVIGANQLDGVVGSHLSWDGNVV